MDIETPAELARTDIQDALLRGVARAYDINQDLYDPDAGHDALSFGIQLWKSTTHFLPMELAELEDVSTAVVNQSLAIQVGRCHLRVHKLGDSELDDPYACFPNHVGPAARMAQGQQLRLDVFQTGEDPFMLSDWVVGHYGSPQEGLRAVRLQAPGDERTGDGTIASWFTVVDLYDARTGAALPLIAVGDRRPTPVVIDEPELTLRQHRGHLPAPP